MAKMVKKVIKVGKILKDVTGFPSWNIVWISRNAGAQGGHGDRSNTDAFARGRCTTRCVYSSVCSLYQSISVCPTRSLKTTSKVSPSLSHSLVSLDVVIAFLFLPTGVFLYLHLAARESERGGGEEGGGSFPWDRDMSQHLQKPFIGKKVVKNPGVVALSLPFLSNFNQHSGLRSLQSPELVLRL